MDKQKRIVPNFLFLGAEKAGSSWIFEVLRAHPQVFVPIAKDIQYFNNYYNKDWNWYLNFFQHAPPRLAVGELSNYFSSDKETAKRIKKYLPNVRLFCILREPVSRTFSEFLFRKNLDVEKDVTFDEFAFNEEILKRSDYYYNLLPYFENFPSQHILVLFYDDLRANPVKFAETIYRFLSVDESFHPQIIHSNINPSIEPRFFLPVHMVYSMGLILRQLGLTNVVGAVKRSELFWKIFSRRSSEKPEIPQAVACRLKKYYSERYALLPQLIGCPLPNSWDEKTFA